MKVVPRFSASDNRRYPKLTRRYLSKLLDEDEVIANVLKSAAILDDLLCHLVVRYFAPKDKDDVFKNLIVDQLSFSRKITILRRARYNRRYKSLAVLKFLEDLGFLRNFLAHRSGWRLGKQEYEALKARQTALQLLQNYPMHFNSEMNRAIDRLARLNLSKEFGGPAN